MLLPVSDGKTMLFNGNLAKIGRKKNQNFLSLQLFELIESNTKKSIHRIVSDNFSKSQPAFLLYSQREISLYKKSLVKNDY